MPSVQELIRIAEAPVVTPQSAEVEFHAIKERNFGAAAVAETVQLRIDSRVNTFTEAAGSNPNGTSYSPNMYGRTQEEFLASREAMGDCGWED